MQGQTSNSLEDDEEDLIGKTIDGCDLKRNFSTTNSWARK